MKASTARSARAVSVSAVTGGADNLQAPAKKRAPAKKLLGFILYEGPSMLDGAPIVVIVNKIDAESDNAKTGALVQTFIIRADVPPTDALKTGGDASVCGNCEHRPILARETGKPPCYVNVGRSVRSVYLAYRNNRYARAPLADICDAVRGRFVRFGTYGDPGAAPVEYWQALAGAAAGHTGYSHQWARIDAAAWAPLVMASADSVADRAAARAAGYRTFRVSTDGADKQSGEIACPASKESGARVTCSECLLCGGTSKRARDIVILDHAAGAKRRVINIARATV